MNVSFATTAFAPVVLGFFGLGVGYFIYGPQELFGWPERNESIDRATGIWGIWMPGFCQFVTGVYLFVALTWFSSLREPPLYMAAFAFSAYGIHWFALGYNRFQRADARPNGFMAIPFTLISILGAVVFFVASSWPVGVLFIGLTGVYVSEFFASLQIGGRGAPPIGEGVGQANNPERSNPGERALGFWHLATGAWLMYLMFSTTLNIASGFHLPGG